MERVGPGAHESAIDPVAHQLAEARVIDREVRRANIHHTSVVRRAGVAEGLRRETTAEAMAAIEDIDGEACIRQGGGAGDAADAATDHRDISHRRRP